MANKDTYRDWPPITETSDDSWMSNPEKETSNKGKLEEKENDKESELEKEKEKKSTNLSIKIPPKNVKFDDTGLERENKAHTWPSILVPSKVKDTSVEYPPRSDNKNYGPLSAESVKISGETLDKELARIGFRAKSTGSLSETSDTIKALDLNSPASEQSNLRTPYSGSDKSQIELIKRLRKFDEERLEELKVDPMPYEDWTTHDRKRPNEPAEAALWEKDLVVKKKWAEVIEINNPSLEQPVKNVHDDTQGSSSDTED